MSRRVTRTLAKQLRNAGGGLLQCVCDEAELLSPNELLIQCTRCGNFLHPSCCHVDTQPTMWVIICKTFVCPRCRATDSRNKAGVDDNGAPGSRQRATSGSLGALSATDDGLPSAAEDAPPADGMFGIGVKRTRPSKVTRVTEHPDAAPTSPAELIALRSAVDYCLRFFARKRKDGLELLAFPQQPLTDDLIDRSMVCCQSSIDDATFSAKYPLFCLQEQKLNHHAYLQGALLRLKRPALATAPSARNGFANSASAGSSSSVSVALAEPQGEEEGEVCSVILSNGMDPYSNLRTTIALLKRRVKSRQNRGLPVLVGAKDSHEWQVRQRLLVLDDASDFVHITLLATHPEHRGHQYATLLLLYDLARWALRGRRRAFVNMALTKAEDGVSRVNEASAALYTKFGFVAVLDASTYNRLGSADNLATAATVGQNGHPSNVESAIPSRTGTLSSNGSAPSQGDDDAVGVVVSSRSAIDDGDGGGESRKDMRHVGPRESTLTSEMDKGRAMVNLDIVESVVAMHRALLQKNVV